VDAGPQVSSSGENVERAVSEAAEDTGFELADGTEIAAATNIETVIPAEPEAWERPAPETQVAEQPAAQKQVPEPPAPERQVAEMQVAERPAAEPAVAGPPADATTTVTTTATTAASPDVLTDLGIRLDGLTQATSELIRLRSRDTDLIARLHEDVTRLRAGEIAAALSPVVHGMIKLYDQMVSLGALNDQASPVGMLHTQLLQIMELTCGVKPFSAEVGDRFDPSRHTGVRRIPAADAASDGTIASTIKAGFARADGSVVRVAEVEVRRLAG